MMRRGSRAAVCLMAVALLTSGCATLQPPPPVAASPDELWSLHRAQITAIRGFSIQGRISDGARTAQMLWHQHADSSFELKLNGPFGIGAVEILGSAGGVVVRSKDGVTYVTDPQAWMVANLGWSVPIENLRLWVTGLPAPGSAGQVRFDEAGRLAELAQNGWAIRYDSYLDVGSRDLPQKVQLENDDNRLRLVIDRWLALDLAAT